MKDRDYLIHMYNATSTDDGKGEIETYEAWLERQLLSRMERLEQIELKVKYILKPEYMNDLFSWNRIKMAIQQL